MDADHRGDRRAPGFVSRPPPGPPQPWPPQQQQQQPMHRFSPPQAAQMQHSRVNSLNPAALEPPKPTSHADSLFVAFFSHHSQAAMLACDELGLVPEDLLYRPVDLFMEETSGSGRPGSSRGSPHRQALNQESKAKATVRYNLRERERQRLFTDLLKKRQRLMADGEVDRLWARRERDEPDAPPIPFAFLYGEQSALSQPTKANQSQEGTQPRPSTSQVEATGQLAITERGFTPRASSGSVVPNTARSSTGHYPKPPKPPPFFFRRTGNRNGPDLLEREAAQLQKSSVVLANFVNDAPVPPPHPPSAPSGRRFLDSASSPASTATPNHHLPAAQAARRPSTSGAASSDVIPTFRFDSPTSVGGGGEEDSQEGMGWKHGPGQPEGTSQGQQGTNGRGVLVTVPDREKEINSAPKKTISQRQVEALVRNTMMKIASHAIDDEKWRQLEAERERDAHLTNSGRMGSQSRVSHSALGMNSPAFSMGARPKVPSVLGGTGGFGKLDPAVLSVKALLEKQLVEERMKKVEEKEAAATKRLQLLKEKKRRNVSVPAEKSKVRQQLAEERRARQQLLDDKELQKQLERADDRHRKAQEEKLKKKLLAQANRLTHDQISLLRKALDNEFQSMRQNHEWMVPSLVQGTTLDEELEDLQDETGPGLAPLNAYQAPSHYTGQAPHVGPQKPLPQHSTGLPAITVGSSSSARVLDGSQSGSGGSGGLAHRRPGEIPSPASLTIPFHPPIGAADPLLDP